jgi:hypothetical protein
MLLNIVKKILIVTRLIVPAVLGGGFFLLYNFRLIDQMSFYIALAASALITLYVYYRMIKKAFRKEKDDGGQKKKKKIKDKEKDTVKIIKEKPKVYRVKQDKNFIMYEYSDKVELYKETKEGLVYIRTDLKR